MEHLSRGTTQDIDELLLIAGHSVKGVRTIQRIRELIAELKLRIKRQSIILNMAPSEVEPLVTAELEKLGVIPDAVIPLDKQIVDFDLRMKPLIELPDDSAAVKAVGIFINNILAQGVKI